ncbi:endolytic transglycosylase MltG [Helicobacter sp. faydin-H17]|nr:endolytic transglycosylase MltG [Helicobacter kayseriensis]MCE3047431.1 endolytic transglycosylase MltG [Helicobacter kayseriensis]
MLPRGTINQIVSYLPSQNIDANRLDSLLLRFFGSPQSGWIDLGCTLISKGDFYYRLTRSKSAMREVKLIPGETMFFFFKDIARIFEIQEDDLWRACKNSPQCIEGNFVPQTYKIPYGADAKDIVWYLLDYSKKAHQDFAQKQGIIYGSQKWKQILSKAAIIQKEAADAKEMPIISAVIDNRIKKGMPLQMDGSLNYGQYSHDKITPKRIREDQSLFNTYKYRGIPPVPSGSVSFEALEASLNPDRVPYLYFVRTKDGRHTFSETYQDHKNNFKK